MGIPLEEISLGRLLKTWPTLCNHPSSNYATGLPLPKELCHLLFKENELNPNELRKKISFLPFKCQPLEYPLSKITGLDIVSGLQKLYMPDHLTVFRAIRFPTPSRIVDLVHHKGLSIINYEHARLLHIYQSRDYRQKRKYLKKDRRFSFIPQERIVEGLPLFLSVNDAIQIHHAFRNRIDKMVIIVAFIPKRLIERGSVRIFTNQPFALNYGNKRNDEILLDFVEGKRSRLLPNTELLELFGRNIYEIYAKGIPKNIRSCMNIGVFQRFFLLDIYRIDLDRNERKINRVYIPPTILDNYQSFLRGIWGEDEIFGRRRACYLPFACNQLHKGTSDNGTR